VENRAPAIGFSTKRGAGTTNVEKRRRLFDFSTKRAHMKPAWVSREGNLRTAFAGRPDRLVGVGLTAAEAIGGGWM
jgi:hypothetical protein